MILSINSSGRVVTILLTGLVALLGCATSNETVSVGPDGGEKEFRIAVLPFENLSGTEAPLKSMRGSLIERLRALGFNVLEEEALEGFMARYRMRYMGGINKVIARAFREETGTDGVLITSLELYSDRFPPKIALTSRMVSTGDDPVILWMDSTGLAGDDSPGILALGVIKDPQRLVEKALEPVSDSLVGYLSDERGGMNLEGGKRKFRPKLSYRSSVIDPGGKYSVAVVPFFNESTRKNAGQIMVLHFVKWLTELENFSVIEPGVVRQELLTFRIIMDEGVSLAQADLIFSSLDADLILSGKVIDYQDFQGFAGKPRVDFSALLVERNTREVVWASKSYNDGDDRVFFFDWGRVNTAHVMASEMTRV
jgi:TolB-like protein